VIRTISADILMNEKSGLMVAVSDDLPGLYVHGRTQSELNERIPVAIKAILEANGEGIFEVVPVDDDVEYAGFLPQHRRFSAALAA